MSASVIRPLAAFLCSLAVHASLFWLPWPPPARPAAAPLQARLLPPPPPLPELPELPETPPPAPGTDLSPPPRPPEQAPRQPARAAAQHPPPVALPPLPTQIGGIPVLQGMPARQALQQLNRQLLYPPAAIAGNQQGQALVLVILDDAGNAIAGRIEESSGFPLLDDAAVRAVRSLRELPADIPREFVLPVRFRLE